MLDGLDLMVHGGEAVAVVGPTGGGKTTLARLIPRFYDVGDGRVLVDGTTFATLKVRDLRRSVGIVFEDTFLFSDTVAENIAFAEPEADRRAACDRAAELAGAADFVDDLPDGYDTIIGEHGFSLSGGQRQRIAIARAVLADPRVLILDDATSSVDPTKEHEIRAALREVMHGRTTLIIAHRAGDDRARRPRRAARRGSRRRRGHPRRAARDLGAVPRGARASRAGATRPARGLGGCAVMRGRPGLGIAVEETLDP